MVNWTAEKDALILRGIFKFHDIKSSGPLLKYLADEIGEGCTPKAVSHRLNNIRGGGKGGGGTPKQATTPKTPKGRTKATPRKKAVNDSDSGPEGPIDDEEEIQSPSAARGKRAASKNKLSYVEPDSETEGGDDGMRKRVKVEPLEPEEDVSSEAYAIRELSEDEV